MNLLSNKDKFKLKYNQLAILPQPQGLFPELSLGGCLE